MEECKNKTEDRFNKALYLGNIYTIKFMIETKLISPVFKDNIAIMIASELGHLEIIEYLLTQSNVDPSVDQNISIALASERGFIQIVELLMKHPKVDPSDNSNLSLQLACCNNQFAVVKILLKDDRIDPCFEDFDGLKTALRNIHIGIVRLLCYYNVPHSRAHKKMKKKIAYQLITDEIDKLDEYLNYGPIFKIPINRRNNLTRFKQELMDIFKKTEILCSVSERSLNTYYNR